MFKRDVKSGCFAASVRVENNTGEIYMSTQETELNNSGDGRNWFVLGGGLLLLLAVALFFIYGLNPFGAANEVNNTVASAPATTQQVNLPQSGPPLQVGDLVYDFTLSDLAGEQVALNEFIGRPLIINYWATWCGPCRIEMPHLQNTFEAHQEDGLVVLALDQDETVGELESFFDEFGLTFTPLLDDGKSVSENYGVGRILPTSFFINADGEITAIHRGPMTQSQIDGYLVETLPPSS
jgi:peroxiredoxin